jgi:hypothetical protein
MIPGTMFYVDKYPGSQTASPRAGQITIWSKLRLFQALYEFHEIANGVFNGNEIITFSCFDTN